MCSVQVFSAQLSGAGSFHQNFKVSVMQLAKLETISSTWRVCLFMFLLCPRSGMNGFGCSVSSLGMQWVELVEHWWLRHFDLWPLDRNMAAFFELILKCSTETVVKIVYVVHQRKSWPNVLAVLYVLQREVIGGFSEKVFLELPMTIRFSCITLYSFLFLLRMGIKLGCFCSNSPSRDLLISFQPLIVCSFLHAGNITE